MEFQPTLLRPAVILFVIVRRVNLLRDRARKAEPAAPPAGPSEEVKLLMEIRDALKK